MSASPILAPRLDLAAQERRVFRAFAVRPVSRVRRAVRSLRAGESGSVSRSMLLLSLSRIDRLAVVICVGISGCTAADTDFFFRDSGVTRTDASTDAGPRCVRDPVRDEVCRDFGQPFAWTCAGVSTTAGLSMVGSDCLPVSHPLELGSWDGFCCPDRSVDAGRPDASVQDGAFRDALVDGANRGDGELPDGSRD